jgi:two-component system CheB/CheR fusion protein
LTDAEAHQTILIAELNHRVRNMLAVAIGLVEHASAKSESLDAFKSDYVNRIRAMSHSYELVSRDNWKDAAVEDLVRQELAPFRSQATFKGPPLRLKPKQALSLGMILHELTTNAIKHGVLAKHDGQLEIEWSSAAEAADRHIGLTWKERSDSGEPPTIVKGFGLRLIEGEATHTLKGRFDMKAEPGLLEFKIGFVEPGDAVT